MSASAHPVVVVGSTTFALLDAGSCSLHSLTLLPVARAFHLAISALIEEPYVPPFALAALPVSNTGGEVAIILGALVALLCSIGILFFTLPLRLGRLLCLFG